MVRWTIIRVNLYRSSFKHSEVQKHFLWKYFATGHGKGVVAGTGGKVKTVIPAKVMSKGDDKIIVQSSNSFSKVEEQLLNKTQVIDISQEEIYSRMSEVIDCTLMKSQPLGLHKKNIHIVTCNDGYTIQTLNHFGGEKGGRVLLQYR